MINAKCLRSGVHLLADFYGVDPAKLKDRVSLMRVLRSSLKESGFTLIKESGSHKFKTGGEGVTGFILLAQSHAAFHSYPEFRYMALDIYTCGDSKPEKVVAAVRKHLRPISVRSTAHRRG